MNCLICKKETYSGIGHGCRLCVMSLENKRKTFCCGDCKDKYLEINDEL